MGKGKQQQRTEGELYPAMMAASRAVGRASESGVEDERATANRPACLPAWPPLPTSDPVLLHPQPAALWPSPSVTLLHSLGHCQWCWSLVETVESSSHRDDPRRRVEASGTDGTEARNGKGLDAWRQAKRASAPATDHWAADLALPCLMVPGNMQADQCR